MYWRFISWCVTSNELKCTVKQHNLQMMTSDPLPPISSLFLFHLFLIFYLKLIWHFYLFPPFSSFVFFLPFFLYVFFLSSSVFIHCFLLPYLILLSPVFSSSFHRRSTVPSTTLSTHFPFIYNKNNKNEAGSKQHVTSELHKEQLTVVRQNHIL